MLNEKQKSAVLADTEKPAQFIAGAGSGKSTVIVARTIKMVQNGKKNILVTTFTRDSKKSLQDKLNYAGVTETQVKVSNFHSVCREILALEGYNVWNSYKPYEVENEFKKVIKDMIATDDILSWISFQKNHLKTCKDEEFIPKDCQYGEEQLKQCFILYEDFKKERNIYDFDDYLIIARQLLIDNPNKYVYDYILVDEAQDSNQIQWDLIDLLCPSLRITIVGDVCQTLYGFRGSKPEYFMNFSKNHKDTTVINMNINYRSDISIVDHSNKFIEQYYSDWEDFERAIPNSDKQGEIELFTNVDIEKESIEVVDKVKELLNCGAKGSDIGILYRNNVQIQFIENELRQRNIEYTINNKGGFFKRKEIDSVICVLRLIHDLNDNSAFEYLFRYRIEPLKYVNKSVVTDIIKYASNNNMSYYDASDYIYTTPNNKRSISYLKSIIERLKTQSQNGYNLTNLLTNIIKGIKMTDFVMSNYHSKEEREERLISLENLKKFIKSHTIDSFLEFVYNGNRNDKEDEKSEDKINLMTIHGSKGLQWKNVFVIGLENGKFPSQREEDIMKEANIFYVATTRPEYRLYLSQIGEFNPFVEEYFGAEDYAKRKKEINKRKEN